MKSNLKTFLFLILLLFGLNPGFAQTENESAVPPLSGDSTCAYFYTWQPSDMRTVAGLFLRKIQTEKLISQIILRIEPSDTCGLDSNDLSQVRMHNLEVSLVAREIFEKSPSSIENQEGVIVGRASEISNLLFDIDKRINDLEDKLRFKKENYLVYKDEIRDLKNYRSELIYYLHFWFLMLDWLDEQLDESPNNRTVKIPFNSYSGNNENSTTRINIINSFNRD